MGYLGRIETDNWVVLTERTKFFYLLPTENEAVEEMYGGWDEMLSSDPFSVQK